MKSFYATFATFQAGCFCLQTYFLVDKVIDGKYDSIGFNVAFGLFALLMTIIHIAQMKNAD